MSGNKVVAFLFCLILFACSNNKNPYENSLGIDPEFLAEIDSAHYTLVKWKDTLVDFGAIRSGDSVNIKFEFTNTGNNLLFVFNARSTCGCTVTGAPKDPVQPGHSGFVTATFNSGTQTGEINKKIFVFTNAKNGRKSNLTIRGVIGPANK